MDRERRETDEMERDFVLFARSQPDVVTKYKIAADCANGAWVARGAFVFVKRNPTESDEPERRRNHCTDFTSFCIRKQRR